MKIFLIKNDVQNLMLKKCWKLILQKTLNTHGKYWRNTSMGSLNSLVDRVANQIDCQECQTDNTGGKINCLDSSEHTRV